MRDLFFLAMLKPFDVEGEPVRERYEVGRADTFDEALAILDGLEGFKSVIKYVTAPVFLGKDEPMVITREGARYVPNEIRFIDSGRTIVEL